ncbi:hypothetical protein DPMN_071650 [Dreissena polymorpha]|uniref:Uncharacterized protein n=1 Tax=Dreissena polymorpha TaxID=45954 RepID=A0A9D3Z856_DREPO|nr:hypothetical protein DPMN_071650 [Dreissena polymorpha]
MTKFHEDWTKIRLLEFKTVSAHARKIPNVNNNNLLGNIKKTAPAPGGHISRVKTAPPPGGHFDEDLTINVTSRNFELDQDIIGINRLTKFYEDQTINLASRVLTRQIMTRNDGQR